MKRTKNKKTPEKETEADEWDLSEGLGIVPSDIPFSQNIGCVGGSAKKPNNSSKKSTN